MSTSSIKRQIRQFHVVLVQWTSEKCTKKHDAHAELIVLITKRIVFLKSTIIVVIVVVA